MIAVLVIGTAAFMLMALSDEWAGVRKQSHLAMLFPVGCFLLAIATVLLIMHEGLNRLVVQPWRFVPLVIGIVSLALLVYTVCFAVSSGSHSKETQLSLVDSGLYAICRHPGVYWLSLFYLCLWGALGGKISAIAWGLFTLLDVLYVWWQDCYVFPQTIKGYTPYQKKTPFLLPTPESFRLGIRQMRERWETSIKKKKGSLK